MNVKKLFAAVAGVSVAMLAGTASATDYVSNQSGNWNNSTIWTPNGVPGASDKATVSHDVDVTDSRTVRRLIVGQGHTLHITGDLSMANSVNGGGQIDGLLWVTDNFFATASSSPSVFVSGTGAILMDGDTPRLRLNQTDAVVLDVTGGSGALIVVDPTPAASGADAYFETAGSGSLSSNSASNQIQINFQQFTDVTLRLDTNTEIHGAVTFIDGSGGLATSYFENYGVVKADSGRIEFDASIALMSGAASSCSAPAYRVASGSYMKFNQDATLSGDFEVYGTLELFNDADLAVAGLKVIGSSGCIDVDSGGSIGYTSICSGGATPPSYPAAVAGDWCP